MPLLHIHSAVEQVATHLREELLAGHWGDTMPGVDGLAADLGVSRKTVEGALEQLENEGLLEKQGRRRRRRIVLPKGGVKPHSLRVAILVYEPPHSTEGYMVELQHLLNEAGHTAFFTRQSLTELGMDVERVAELVGKTAADAWIVCSGSREVLDWFATGETPTFALFGRRQGLPIAAIGPDKSSALATVAQHLVDRGHRRIVLLARSERRLPEPGASERTFLDKLQANGIAVGSYNLPHWEESVAGFHQCLDGLFDMTPPTALVIDEAPFFFAAQQFLAGRGLKVPGNVSLVCTDADRNFAWCQPSVAHIHWDSRPVVRRIVRWVAKVSRGKEDLRQTITKAEFIGGGTVGAAPVAPK